MTMQPAVPRGTGRDRARALLTQALGQREGRILQALSAISRQGGITEEAIHRAVVHYVEAAKRPDVMFNHIPSGEARGRGIGGKLKGMGHRPGWPDLMFIHQGVAYGLELKRPGGCISPAQREAQAGLLQAGASIATVYSFEEAVAQIKRWGLVRGAPP